MRSTAICNLHNVRQKKPASRRLFLVRPDREVARPPGRSAYAGSIGATMSATILLAISLLLVAACGMFVAAEFAFVTVDRNKVDRAVEDGDRAAAGVQTALRSLSTQLSGAQVGITVTNLAIGFLAEPAISQLVDGPSPPSGCLRTGCARSPSVSAW